jgi:hypothetical protein
MQRFTVFLFLLFLTELGFSQSKVTPATRSELSGIELPTGSKQDKRILATASAKTLLDMISEDNQMILEDGVEVFLLIGTVGSGTVDQVKLAAQKAGWNLTSLAGQTKYWLLKKHTTTLLMYVESNKKETPLYLSRVKEINTITSPAVSQNSTDPQNQTTDQPIMPVTVTTSQKDNNEQKVVTVPTPASASGFAFTTINFDDGWVSNVREDWVEVTKGNVKVLIHYPNPTTNQYISNPDEEKRIAWNTLVAPRYSNLQNYFIARNAVSYFQGFFISGTLTDNQTGQTFYVVLFKRDRSPWMEFIAPNITTFGQVTGFNVAALHGDVSNSEYDPLQKLEGYNRFAVAASDLSAQTFEFLNNGTYNWSIGVASGFVGNIKFSSAKSSGKFTNPNNWQIHFSDLEGKPKLYNAYFSCVKGARILWLQDTSYGGYSSYGRQE